MSLENIQLPARVITDLFKDSLVELQRLQPNHKKAAAVGFQMLGKFLKKVLILVDNSEAIYLPDEELQFLLGILSACKLTMEDVSIANLQKNNGLTYTTISKELKPAVVLLFGIETEQIELPLSFPAYQVQKYNQHTFLCAPPLATLQKNVEEKKLLWKSLQQIFLS